MNSSYWKKYQEAEYNLNLLHELFRNRDENCSFCINNFLSSDQSVFWILNKSFSNNSGYETWRDNRGSRLPVESKIFKELRNISIKEYPVEQKGVILSFTIDNSIIPDGAVVTSPTIDSVSKKFLSEKLIVSTKEGLSYEIEGVKMDDFTVKCSSIDKEYIIEQFITKARHYLDAIKKEIEETERKFLKT